MGTRVDFPEHLSGDAFDERGGGLPRGDHVPLDQLVEQRPGKDALPVDRRMDVVQEALVAKDPGRFRPRHGRLQQPRPVHKRRTAAVRRLFDGFPDCRGGAERADVLVHRAWKNRRASA